MIWSLCVLIERAAEEVKRGLIGNPIIILMQQFDSFFNIKKTLFLGWPFWTKLVVVTVGLTGGVVFMYIQCRQYLQLCHRWRARNRSATLDFIYLCSENNSEFSIQQNSFNSKCTGKDASDISTITCDSFKKLFTEKRKFIDNNGHSWK